jgi:2-polyprenyl-6-methoxyphenol hydroxylase-like FAD-dependent oxidoreductase
VTITEQVECCVVGGGPAGVVLAYLLARAGVEVALLEAQRDFDRDFRGDAVFAWVMELMDQLGLAEGLLSLPHRKVRGYTYRTGRGQVLISDYSRLASRFPFVTAIPQNQLLDYVAGKSGQFRGFRLEMGAAVNGILTEGSSVAGVRYVQDGRQHRLSALVTVGADGRSSKLRTLGEFDSDEPFPPQFDVLWLRLPRLPGDGEEIDQQSLFGRGFYISLIDRGDRWQVAYTIRKGSYRELRAAGLEAFRRSIAELVPAFAGRLQSIEGWSQLRLLPVRMSYVRRWSRAGLLLIGDAAHVMSSIGGVGIMCAMQDAVETANVLVEGLRDSRLEVGSLARVQRRRGLPTRVMQFLQFVVERQYVRRALNPDREFRVPIAFRLPGIRALIARVTAYGVWPVRLRV